MASTKCNILAVSLVFALGAARGQNAASSSATIDELRSQHRALSADIRAKSETIEKAAKDLDALSTEIQQLKKKNHGSTGFLQKYKLQSRLQEAQTLSEKVTSLKHQKSEDQKKIAIVQQSLVRSLDQQIEGHRKNVIAKNISLAIRQESATQLFQLLQDRFSVISFAYDDASTDNAPALPPLAKEQEELQEQLLAMDDIENKLSKEMESLQHELVAAKRQKFLQRELSQLFEEEAFFGEQGFIRVGSAKENSKKDSTTNALSTNTSVKTEEPAADTTVPTTNPTSNSPGIAPATGSAVTPLTTGTTENSGSMNTPGSGGALSTTLPGGVDRNGTASQDRNKLMRSQKEDPKSLIETTNLDRQIRWLNQQLDQTKSFLGNVKKTKKEIQSVLPHP